MKSHEETSNWAVALPLLPLSRSFHTPIKSTLAIKVAHVSKLQVRMRY